MPIPSFTGLATSWLLAAVLSLAAAAEDPPSLDEAEAIRRLGDASSAAWIEGGTLFAVVRTPADSVSLLSAVQGPLRRLESPGLWGGAFPLVRADEAVMSCGFAVTVGESVERRHDTPAIRGPRARPAPSVAEPLRGQVSVHTFESPSLGMSRAIHVYLPPDVEPAEVRQVVVLADGQATATYATVVEPLVVSGRLPPTAIVGVASDTSGGRGDPASDFRGMEYLKGFAEFAPGADPTRFDQHWRFFTEEVPAWIRDTLGITVGREGRIVVGTSNGGAFAATVAALASDRFGASIVLSSGWLTVPELFTAVPAGADAPRAFFSAGLYEPGFLEQTRATHAAAVAAGYRAVLDERVGGHDPLIWREQLAAGLQWLLPPAGAEAFPSP